MHVCIHKYVILVICCPDKANMYSCGFVLLYFQTNTSNLPCMCMLAYALMLEKLFQQICVIICFLKNAPGKIALKLTWLWPEEPACQIDGVLSE